MEDQMGVTPRWTDLYRRCHLHVSWWSVPYQADRIRPVRRREHRRSRRRSVLPVQSYLWRWGDVTAYRQETIREVGVEQSSCTTQRACVLQRSWVYSSSVLDLRGSCEKDSGVLFDLPERSQLGGVPETYGQVWRRLPADSGKTREWFGRSRGWWRERSPGEEALPLQDVPTAWTISEGTASGGNQLRQVWRQRQEGGFFCWDVSSLQEHTRFQRWYRRPHEDICRRTRDYEPEEEVYDWKYLWRKDHGYFTFAEVVWTGFPGTTLHSMQPTIRGHQGCLKKSTAVMES